MVNKLIEKYHKFLVILFLISFFVQATTSSLSLSYAVDDFFYIGMGRYLFETGNFDIWPIMSSGILNYYINSIFIFFLDYDKSFFPTEGYLYFNTIAPKLAFGSNNNPILVRYLFVLPYILMGVCLGVYLYLWAKKLYGKKAALFALFLYSFSPNILAYVQIPTSDFGITFFIFITAYYLWEFINNPNTWNLIRFSVSFGLALLIKQSVLFILPPIIIVLLFALYKKKFNFKYIKIAFFERRHNLKRFYLLFCIFCYVFLISFFIIFAAYWFKVGTLHSTLSSKQDYNELEKYEAKLEEVFGDKPLLYRAFDFFSKNVPIPAVHYLKVVLSGVTHSLAGHASFLMGEYSQYGWWYYFIIVFVVKTPLATMLLLILSIVFYKRIKLKSDYEAVVILIPLMFFLIFLNNKVQLGVRHILPIYPFIFLFSSRIVNLKLNKYRGVFNIFLAMLLVWYLVSSILVYPFYYAYFNEAIGGPSEGYNYLVEANSDWGQALPFLASYLKENNIDNISACYFGVDKLENFGITYKQLDTKNCTPTDGFIAISTTCLNPVYLSNKNCFDWLKKHEPVKKIGYSIFVYDLRS